jgi:hypothetical protein
MAIKSFGIFASILILSGILFARPVDSTEAAVTAKNFLTSLSINESQKSGSHLILKQSFRNETQTLLYLFTNPQGGFVLISGDDLAVPVLGYSGTGVLSESLPPAFEYWMAQYSKEIERIIQNGAAPDNKISALWENYRSGEISVQPKDGKSVSPLLNSTWNQGTFYNYLCPEDPDGPGGHVWAGCVATAMAQAMYYYRYPLQGTGSSGYYSDYGYLSADYGSTSYDWNQMSGSIANTFNYQMALIQYHCGIAVEMMYSPTGSGAYMWDATQAMISYFGYNPGAELRHRDNYTSSQWEAMLTESLDDRHPVVYAGYGQGGGHAFVCDGYQGGGYFHFNWGWGGSADGYFYLDNLNPSYDFTNGQQGIFNMYPATSYPFGCNGTSMLTSMSGSLEDGSGPMDNYAHNKDCMWLIQPTSATQKINLNFIRFDTETGQDIVTVYDGATVNDPILGIFSGSSIPAVVSSTGSALLVRFQTNASANASGWLAEYKAVPYKFCDNLTELTAPNGTFSDGSGTSEYSNSTYCIWRIAPPGANSIGLNFTSFDVEAQYDFLKIYDEAAGTEIGTYSGTNPPPSMILYTSRVLLIFKTNSYNTAQGWSAEYFSSESGMDPSETLLSAVFPNPASEELTMKGKMKTGAATEIRMFNSQGQCVLEKNYTASAEDFSFTFNVGSLEPGIYFLQLRSDDTLTTEKIVISR